jgi:hypothetical protein
VTPPLEILPETEIDEDYREETPWKDKNTGIDCIRVGATEINGGESINKMIWLDRLLCLLDIYVFYSYKIKFIGTLLVSNKMKYCT